MTDRYTDVENEGNRTPETTSGTLESDVGPEVYRELHAAFLDHLSLQVVDLTTAAANGDVPAAQYVAHQIKGTAPSFGANRLDELAKRVLRMDMNQSQLLASLVHEIQVEVGSIQAVVDV